MHPKIGIVSSAHRPQNWMDLYKSIGNNDIEFELVFVGPNPPAYELPKNFRFIRSLVKPTQCFEIAFRNTSANYVMPIADDTTFRIPRPLDRLYETYKSYNNDKIILSCRYMMNGQEQPSGHRHFFPNDIDSPIMATSGLMYRKLWISIGGIDRNFIGIMWDLDIAMRVHALGGDIIYSDVFLDEDNEKGSTSVLCKEFWRHDRGVLEGLWTANGKVHFNREKPVESFSDMNILNASQGPRGRWRGNGPLFYEKAEDRYRSIFGYTSIFGRLNRGIRKPSMYLNYVKRVVLRLKKNRLPDT
ncbi:MAG: hypothetical protein ABIL62_10970, partial [Planctomycetota bacterium]